MRLRTRRISIRVAAWPSIWPISETLFAVHYYPRNCAELVEAIEKCGRKYCKCPAIIGAGWGHFLSRTASKGPRIFTHKMCTYEMQGKTVWWNAGATIYDVAKYYEREGRALTTAPTMDHISVGAWFAMGNHGNGGNHACVHGSSGTMHLAEVMDMETFCRSYCNYEQIREIFDDECKQKKFCILRVSLKSDKLIDNIWLQKSAIAIEVGDANSAQRWLKEGAFLRVLFMGSARKYALGIRWDCAGIRPVRGKDHIDPHCCQRFCTWLQADVCSAWIGWREQLNKWTGYTTYANANRWMPPLFPIQTALTVLLGYKNFELIFRWNKDNNDSAFLNFVLALIKMHECFGGRSEIRWGNNFNNAPMFLDVSMYNNLEQPLIVLRDHGVIEYALHPGKYQPQFDKISEPKKVTQGKIYFYPTVHKQGP